MSRDYYDCCFCDDAAEGSRVGLLAIMAGISEEHWCAGWMSGLEYSLWRMVEGGQRDYGMGEVSVQEVALLKALSEHCDGWWVHVAHEGPQFLRMARWREHLVAQGIEAGTGGDASHGEGG